MSQPSLSKLSAARSANGSRPSILKKVPRRAPNPSEPNRTQKKYFPNKKSGQLGKQTVNTLIPVVSTINDQPSTLTYAPSTPSLQNSVSRLLPPTRRLPFQIPS